MTCTGDAVDHTLRIRRQSATHAAELVGRRVWFGAPNNAPRYEVTDSESDKRRPALKRVSVYKYRAVNRSRSLRSLRYNREGACVVT